MTWGAVAVGGMVASTVVGGAVSYMGAKKNAAAMDRATEANLQQAREANAQSLQMYHEQQGVAEDGTPINRMLPRYFGVSSGGGLPVRAVTLNKNQMGLGGGDAAFFSQYDPRQKE